MAEAEVTLTYREWRVTVLNWALLACLPVVALFVLLCTLNVGQLPNGQSSNISIFIFGLFTLLSSVILGLVATSDRTIFLTRDGISLPFIICPRPGFRSQHAWSELAGVKLLPGGRYGTLALRFKDGAQARLKLELFSAQEIENLIVSMDVWAGGSDTFPALLEARAKLARETSDLHTTGYTEIWEEELTRRFGPTNFVPLEPGHEVRGLIVERQLAFGGLSAIYLVGDHNKHRSILKEAVIPIDADQSLRTTAETMFAREAQILASLSHPNLAQVRDNFVEAGRNYILMDYIEGQDLRRLVKEYGPQSQEDVLAWSDQLLDILDYLHSRDPAVIHRDISPDNLMLKPTGELFVIDFGAANHFVGAATGTLIGKQAYIAPEQLRGKAEPASDIYAFGCTLHFLLTGKDPEPLSVAHPRETNSAISNELDEIIACCTAQEANERPGSAAELRLQLKHQSKALRHA